MMQRLRLSLAIVLWRCGAGSVIAAFLLLAAGALWFGWIRPLQSALKQSAAQRAAGAASSMQAPAQPLAATQQEALTALTFKLPQSGSLEALLKDIYAVAAKEGVQVQGAEYQYRRERESSWLQASLNISVRGTYPATRRVIEALLRSQQHLSLDEMSLKREGAETNHGEISLRWTAWFRLDSAQQPR
jgi:Tfp pilus assembly protein PilO